MLVDAHAHLDLFGERFPEALAQNRRTVAANLRCLLSGNSTR
jgi:predicted amidohydrolase YtcJ